MSPTKNHPLQDATAAEQETSRKGRSIHWYDDTIVLSDPQTLFKHAYFLACSTPQALGTVGEIYAREMLEAAGYYARPANRFEGDLFVKNPTTGAIYHVEVKIARKNKSGWWQFLLYKKDKTDAQHSDFVILLQVTDSCRVVPYVIPTKKLKVKQIKLSAPERYSGKYAKFRASFVPPANIQYQLTSLGKRALSGALPY